MAGEDRSVCLWFLIGYFGFLERTAGARVIATKNGWDVAAGDTQIVEFAVRHSVELATGFAEFGGFFGHEEHCRSFRLKGDLLLRPGLFVSCYALQIGLP